jgi:NitT/TauT family transport system substrate-binding protein
MPAGRAAFGEGRIASMIRRTRAGAIRVLASTALAALAFADARADEEVATIRIASSPNDQVAPVLYGIEAGLFSRAGLDVSITSMRSGAEIAGAVLGGSLEFGGSDVVAPLIAHAKGIPLVLVAPTLYYDASHPNVAMLVSATSTIRSAADLRGKTIGVNALHNSFALAVMAWLGTAGIDPLNAVQFIEIPPAAEVQALAQGRIDATVAYEPVLSSALAQGAKIIGYPYDAFGRRTEPTAYWASVTWVRDHRSALRRFTDVLRVATTYVAANESAVFPLTAKFTGMPLDVVAKMHPSMRAFALEPAAIQPYIDAAAKYGFIPQAFPARDFIA